MANLTTYRELITGSYRLAGILGTGQTLQGSQGPDAIYALQEMMDEWNSDALKLYTIGIYSIPITNAKQQYTIGPGGDFNITNRPPLLSGAWFQQLTTAPFNDIPVTLVSAQDWGNIRAKGTQGNVVTYGYYDQNFPVATLFVWPLPSMAAGSLILHAPSQLNSSIGLDDYENLPPAYRKAIRYNLAMVLAAENGFEPSMHVKSTAANSLMMLQRNNGQIPQRMTFDSAALGSGSGRYLIESDSRRWS